MSPTGKTRRLLLPAPPAILQMVLQRAPRVCGPTKDQSIRFCPYCVPERELPWVYASLSAVLPELGPLAPSELEPAKCSAGPKFNLHLDQGLWLNGREDPYGVFVGFYVNTRSWSHDQSRVSWAGSCPSPICSRIMDPSVPCWTTSPAVRRSANVFFGGFILGFFKNAPRVVHLLCLSLFK